MNIVRNYFRFGRPRSTGRATALSGSLTPQPGSHPLLPVMLQFAAIVFGVFAQPLAAQVRHGNASAVDFGFVTTGWFIISLFIAVIVFPGAYRPQSPSPQPRFVQFCVLFGAGIGWQAIFDTIVK